MMKQNTLTQGSILKSLLTFAIPVFVALLLQAMYGAVDLLVVGKFAEIADQSGVATGSMFTTSFSSVITCFAIGVTVLIAEAMGSGMKERASKGIGAGIALFAILAVLSTILLACFAEPIAVAMRAPADALPQTTSYIRICGGGIVFIIAYNVLGAIFRGLGDSKTPLITVAIAFVINVAGDLLFVIVFHMGAAGAALATVLAQAMSVLISLLIIRRRELPFTLSPSDIRLWPTYVKKIVWVGIPVALQELLVGFSFIYIQATVNTIGLVQSAAIGVGEKVCVFLMLVASAYMQSMAAFVAQNNGAGKHHRAQQALKFGILTAFAAGFCMALLAFFGGSHLASIFSTDAAVITAAHSYLKAYAFDNLLTGILFCFIGYFNGCEKALFVMVQGIVGAFFVRVPLVSIFCRITHGALFWIGMATPISSVVQIVLCLVTYVIFEKRAKQKGLYSEPILW